MADDPVTVTQEKWQALIPVSMEAAPDLFVVQHTYTRACDGLHARGPCPPSREPIRVEVRP